MSALAFVFDAVSGIIILDAVLSWVQREHQFPRVALMQLTEPLYAPIRAILPPSKLGGLDISPLVILFALRAIKGALLA